MSDPPAPPSLDPNAPLRFRVRRRQQSLSSRYSGETTVPRIRLRRSSPRSGFIHAVTGGGGAMPVVEESLPLLFGVNDRGENAHHVHATPDSNSLQQPEQPELLRPTVFTGNYSYGVRPSMDRAPAVHVGEPRKKETVHETTDSHSVSHNCLAGPEDGVNVIDFAYVNAASKTPRSGPNKTIRPAQALQTRRTLPPPHKSELDTSVRDTAPQDRETADEATLFLLPQSCYIPPARRHEDRLSDSNRLAGSMSEASTQTGVDDEASDDGDMFLLPASVYVPPTREDDETSADEELLLLPATVYVPPTRENDEAPGNARKSRLEEGQVGLNVSETESGCSGEEDHGPLPATVYSPSTQLAGDVR